MADQSAAAISAQDDVNDYFIVDASVESVLQLISSDQALRIDSTDRVLGRVRKQRLTGTIEEILGKLASQYALDWFSFNGVYYVSSRRETLTRLVRLGRLDEGRALDALTEAGLNQDRFPSRPTADGTALALSGPPKYLGIAEAVLESVPDVQISALPQKLIRVRRGIEYADVVVSNPTTSSGN